MLKIIMYSIDYSEGVLREAPYAAHYVERGLSHLGDLTDPETRLVYLTTDGLPPAVLDYHLADVCGFTVEQQRSARDRLTVRVPKETGHLSLGDRVAHDDELLDWLAHEVAKAPAAELLTFAPSARLEEIGARLGVPPSERPVDLAEQWGSKAGSKAAFRRSGVTTPRGGDVVHRGVDAVRAAALDLGQATPPARYAMVKLDDGSWTDGIGNAVLDTTRLAETGSMAASVTVSLQPWELIEAEIARAGAIVEEFLPDAACSPSGQGHIAADGSVSATSSHEQFVVSGQYSGCEFPAARRFSPTINDAVLAVGRTLSAEGLRGSFGIDFVGLADGDLHAVEINTRKVAPSHVVAHVLTAVGLPIGPNGITTEDGITLCYSHRRVYLPELKQFSPDEALAALRERGLLYRRDARAGVLLHILTALQTCGYIEITAIDHDPVRATALRERAEAVLLRQDAVVTA